jgi:hypothetical protein
MPDSKITALTALTAADPATDMFPVVDVSDTTMAASGTTKRISINNILACSPSATLASATITGDLTVRTNKLAVTSTGVGCGTSTPADSLHVYGSGNALIEGTSGLYARTNCKVGAKTWQVGYRSGTGQFEIQEDLVERYTIGNGGTPHTWYIGASTAMTLNATGLGVGVTPSAGRGAIQLSAGVGFPATQVASSDANCLDDYEEGTWTPVVIGTTTNGVGTYTNQVGFYTKVGNLVTVQAYITWTAHTATGNMRLSGLPFANSATAGSFSAVAFGYVNNLSLTAGNILTGFTSVGNTFIDCFQTPTGGGASTSVPIDTAAELIYTVTYRV